MLARETLEIAKNTRQRSRFQLPELSNEAKKGKKIQTCLVGERYYVKLNWPR